MQAVHPIRAENFSVNHSGEGRCARQAHKRVDNLRFSTLLGITPFSLEGLGADGRLRKRRKGGTTEDFFYFVV